MTSSGSKKARQPAANPDEVRAQLDRLRNEMTEWAKGAEEADASQLTHVRQVLVSRWRLILKSAVALAAALLFGAVPLQRILSITSSEAIVNARLVTLRAPIEGILQLPVVPLEVGKTFLGGEAIVAVRNPIVDRSAYHTVRRARDQIAASVDALAVKRRSLETRKQQLMRQVDAFRAGRIEQVENRIAEIDAQINGASARHKESALALGRAKALGERGVVTTVAIERAVREERVAREDIVALQERRQALRVELEGARNGTFIGDSYNDTPQSAQRVSDLDVELADLDARSAALKAELQEAETQLSAEEQRLSTMTHSSIVAPVRGRVWEVMASAGEYVGKGQEVVRLLDCETAIVTAAVGESSYQKLTIGQAARFRPRAGGSDLLGAVISLKGPAGATASAAIQKLFLHDPYQVQLRFPDLARHADCGIGRTGLVIFERGGREVE